MSRQDKCDEMVVLLAELELAIDRATKKAGKVLDQSFATQKEFCDNPCTEPGKDGANHANRFSDFNAMMGRTISKLTATRALVTEAHSEGQAICADGGVIIVTGGGK